MNNLNRILFFVSKYKLLHIAFWIWNFFQTIHLRQQFRGGSFDSHISITISQLLFQMMAVYIIIYGLIPRYLEKNKLLKFFILAASVIVVMAFTQVIAYKTILHFVSGKEFVTSNILLFTITGITDMAIIAALFVTFTFLGSIYQKDQLNKRLEKEKLETELNFLKSQTSPHFLFNALNSIYVLIDLDQKKAREILLKFSALLRYQLYECNSAVFLSKELEFLENYIELEKIRKKNLEVVYNKSEELPAFEIMPFLLLPLVENAFKHVSPYYDGKNFIRINISANELQLHAEVINSYDETVADEESSGGIGLRNIERRLLLLYPGRHEFQIKKSDKIFTAKLTIHADKNKLHHR